MRYNGSWSFPFWCIQLSIIFYREKIVDIAWVDAYSSAMQFIFSFFSFSIVLIDHFNCPSACLKNTNTFSFYFFERTRKLKDRYCLRWLFFPIMTVHQCIRRKKRVFNLSFELDTIDGLLAPKVDYYNCHFFFFFDQFCCFFYSHMLHAHITPTQQRAAVVSNYSFSCFLDALFFFSFRFLPQKYVTRHSVFFF